MNECIEAKKTNTTLCPKHTICRNTQGSYECHCRRHYKPTGESSSPLVTKFGPTKMRGPTKTRGKTAHLLFICVLSKNHRTFLFNRKVNLMQQHQLWCSETEPVFFAASPKCDVEILDCLVLAEWILQWENSCFCAGKTGKAGKVAGAAAGAAAAGGLAKAAKGGKGAKGQYEPLCGSRSSSSSCVVQIARNKNKVFQCPVLLGAKNNSVVSLLFFSHPIDRVATAHPVEQPRVPQPLKNHALWIPSSL